MNKATVTPVEKCWLSVKEAEKYLGCSRKYLYKLLNNGKIQAAQEGKMTFFVKKSIDKYLTSLTIQPKAVQL